MEYGFYDLSDKEIYELKNEIRELKNFQACDCNLTYLEEGIRNNGMKIEDNRFQASFNKQKIDENSQRLMPLEKEAQNKVVFSANGARDHAETVVEVFKNDGEGHNGYDQRPEFWISDSGDEKRNSNIAYSWMMSLMSGETVHLKMYARYTPMETRLKNGLNGYSYDSINFSGHLLLLSQ